MTSTHGPSGIRRIAWAFAVVPALAALMLTAAPAHADAEAIVTTLSVTADPAMPGSAVLRAEMIGPYVDSGGPIPAGSWSFLVADRAGAILFSQEVSQPAGGPTTAEVVWSEVPPGVSANGIVTYVPSESSEQLTFAGATAAFQAEGTIEEADISRTEATPTAAAADPVSPWPGILLVSASLLVAAGGIVLLVRRDRRSVDPGT